MNRLQLEHIIRASGTISQDKELIIFGSQAILAQFPNAPVELLVSVEADICPKNFPDRADLIDGSIGEGSPFQSTFGYHAHGVSVDTAILPEGWKDRLVPIKNENTLGITGWCIEINDLALSKYVAGREKDLKYTNRLAKDAMTSKDILLERYLLLPANDQVKNLVKQRILRDWS